MTRTLPSACLFAFSLLLALPSGAEEAHSTPTEDNIRLESPSERQGVPQSRRYLVRSGGGCVAGAILGSVIPGLGNVVGCAVGALGGWMVTWLQQPEDFLDDEP